MSDQAEDATAFNTDNIRVYAANKNMDAIAFYDPTEDGRWVSADNPVTLRHFR